ncbi:MAG: circadian clock protein KaiB [Verrucomicrobiaceae bacterium]|nr:MAG: circadian clock protein KaiB [Verrucomicrobiaceae bacterium]
MNTLSTDQPAQSQGLVLELYIVGDSPRSAAALTNLEAIRKKYLPQAKVEVVDVWENPRRILTNNVFITPMLVRVAPGPTCRIVGDLSDEEKVLQALGITAELSVEPENGS